MNQQMRHGDGKLIMNKGIKTQNKIRDTKSIPQIVCWKSCDTNFQYSVNVSDIDK